jgi:NAD+ synthase
MPLHPWLSIDLADTAKCIPQKMREIVSSTLLLRGCVVAVSGGIDSSVCASLATLAMGKEKVFALVLPERDSSPRSKELGVQLCEHLGIRYEVKDIASTLDAIGCYQWRDDAIRSVFPDYMDGWKNKIVISQNLLESDRINFFKMVVENPQGERMEKRLPVAAYLQIVAATNFKQRIRKTLEFFHADRLNYAVVGTPNRLEYDRGFFVKNGDGAADIKPIAHLYKSQVYQLANHLGLPKAICAAKPITDTYSLQQGQDEFYFVLPYDRMDIILCGLNAGKTAGEVAKEVGLTAEQVERVFHDIRTKRTTTRPLHLGPVLMEMVPEITK